jgi:hypothetical protein
MLAPPPRHLASVTPGAAVLNDASRSGNTLLKPGPRCSGSRPPQDGPAPTSGMRRFPVTSGSPSHRTPAIRRTAQPEGGSMVRSWTDGDQGHVILTPTVSRGEEERRRCRRRLSVSIAVVFRQLYGGCWWVREVTCPKSQRAGFQLAALDIRAAPECPPGPTSSLFASLRSWR